MLSIIQILTSDIYACLFTVAAAYSNVRQYAAILTFNCLGRDLHLYSQWARLAAPPSGQGLSLLNLPVVLLAVQEGVQSVSFRIHRVHVRGIERGLTTVSRTTGSLMFQCYERMLATPTKML